jgi:hypothetical protein
VLHCLLLPTNHEAESSVETEDTTARAHVNVSDALRGQLLRADNVIAVVRVATVYQDVPWIH